MGEKVKRIALIIFALALAFPGPIHAKEQPSGKLPSYSLLEATVSTKSRFNGHYLVKKQGLTSGELALLAKHFIKKYKRHQIVVLRLWDNAEAYKEYKTMMDPRQSDVGDSDYWTRYDQVTSHLLISYEKNRSTGVENLLVLGEEKALSSQ